MSAYTEADVQLVTRALGADYWTDDERAEAARAILTALADAGRLTPDGAEVEEEWTYGELDEETGHVEPEAWDQVFDSRDEAEAQLTHLRTVLPGPTWSAVRIARRERIAGPWVAVDGTP